MKFPKQGRVKDIPARDPALFLRPIALPFHEVLKPIYLPTGIMDAANLIGRQTIHYQRSRQFLSRRVGD